MSVVRLAVAPILAFLLTAPAVAARVEPTGKAVPNEVIVKVRGNASQADIIGIEDLAGADTSQRIATLSTGTLLRLRGPKSAEAMAAALGAHEDIEFVEPNYIVRIAAVPNDPSYAQLWSLRNTGQTIVTVPGSGGADIDAEAAWSVTTGTQSVVVGVIDTGVDYDHPDLAANMWSNPGGKGNAACAAGTHGFNSLTGTCNPMDDEGHGTHVAGTIGAAGNNGVGVAGVNWTTSIMALKFLDYSGNGTVAGAIAAIDFAVQAKIDGVNVRVLSNSWGGFPFSRALLDVINKANEHDILFVASAGNSTRNTDTSPHFPSNYGSANLLSVAATDNRDGLAYFSNYGAATVHLGAPGVNVLSTMRNGGYTYSSGTSMAAPHVSGVAALVLAQFPSYTTAQVKNAILAGTDPLPSLAGRTVTGGRLNAAKALGASATPDFSLVISPTTRTVMQGGTTVFTLTINRYNGFTGTVTLAVSDLPTGATATFAPQPATSTATMTVSTSSTTPATPSANLTVTGTGGSLTRSAVASLRVDAVPAAGACPSFISGVSSSLSSPAAVAIGDFSNDGRTDHALADAATNVLWVYRRGSSTLAFPVGRTPAAIAAGDFNADGRTDLVTANSGSHDVSILLANAAGGFHTPVAYGAGTSPLSVAAGDFNRDGRTDLAVANNGSGNVSVLLAQSGGTFAAAIHYATGSGPFWVTVADADGDGRDDLAVANHNANTVSLLRGNGDGTFASPLQTAAGTKPSSVAAADFTGDGAIDLAVSNYGANQVTLLSGNGDGTFASAGAFPTGVKPLSVSAGDIDGNGKLDLVTANEGSSNVSILLAAGFGAFAGPIPRDVTFEPSQAAVGDIDDDGRPDVVAAVPEYGRAVIHYNRSACALNCGALAGAAHGIGGTPQATAAADFDRDGILDLAVVDSASNDVAIRLGNGDGTFTAGVTAGAGTAPLGVAAGDFNRDGKPDLAVASTGSNEVVILAGNGDGTFQSGAAFATGTAPRAVTVADFDRDGKLDLALPARDANSVSVLRGNGDGTFQAFASYAAGTSPRAAVAADFNRDGLLDLATANAGSASVSVLLGNSDGTFQAAVHYAAGTTPRGLTAADLDNDGFLDLATANFGSNDVSVLLGNGNGTFDAAVAYAAGTGPSGIAAIDVNGDALRDLVTSNQGSHDVSLLTGLGSATFAATASFAAGLSPAALTAADFDRDGKTDFAVPNGGAASFSVFRNTCPLPDLTIAKTHAGAFAQGGTGSYTITVTNAGVHATSGTVTVADTLPQGLALTSISGTGWTCSTGTATCTRGDALAPGASYPPIALAVRIYGSAAASLTNVATVSGGGEVNPTNNTASDPTSIVATTDLLVMKSHIGAFAQGATGRKYTLVVRNAGGLPTSGTVTVTDTLPAGLTATAMSGAGWSCNTGSLTCTRNDSLAGGGNFPAITVTVNVAADAPALVVNSAAVSGGGDASPANNTATDPTIVWSTNTCASFGASTYYSDAGPFFALGDFNGDGRVDVAGADSSILSIRLGAGDGTFLAPLLSEVPYTASIAAGDLDRDGDLDLVLGTNMYDSQLGVLLGNGDGTFAPAVQYDSGVNYGIDLIEIADLDRDGSLDVAAFGSGDATTVLLGNGDGTLRPAVTLSHTQGVQAWTVADLTGDGQLDLLTASDFGLNVRPGNGDGTFAAAIASPASFWIAGVVAGDFNGDGMTDAAAVTYDEVIVLTGNGDGTFDAGVPYPVGYGSSVVTTSDINADGVLDLVTSGGSGHLSTLLGNGDGTFQTANAYWAASAYRLKVTDFNGDGRADLASSSYDGLSVMLGGCADLTITKEHTGDFHPGETGVYRIRVANDGEGTWAGTMTVTDLLPQGLTATSIWSSHFYCTQSTLTCTYTGTLAPGNYREIEVYVSVSSTAPSTVVNTATLTAPGDPNPANNTASDPTNIVLASDLIVTKTHSGSVWTPGQSGTYTISVGNIGSGPTSGTVTVTDQLPWPLSALSMGGSGWSCQSLTCTRSDTLGPTAVYPPITLVVSIPSGATSVNNYVTVSGGGDTKTWNNSASDYTRILSTPYDVVATAGSASQATVTWNASAVNGTQYEIHRSAAGGAYVHIGNTLGLSYIDNTVTANTVYLYKVRLVEGGVAGPFSSQDLTNTIAFTDDPVVARVTRIKRLHIEELRTAVNTARTAAGMATTTFTDPALQGIRIKKVHIAELRTAINQLRDFLGIGGVVFEDSTSIKAAHITALRTALR